MGADIDLFVEKRSAEGVFVALRPDATVASPIPGSPPDRTEVWRNDPRWPYKRNYLEFALLGGRRGEWQYPPIVPIRDVPEDCSTTVAQVLRAEVEAQSASWCTLAELLTIDWEATVPFRSCVYYDGPDRQLVDIDDPEEFNDFVSRSGTIPDTWHGQRILVGWEEPEGWYENWTPGTLRTLVPLRVAAPGIVDLVSRLSELGAPAADVRIVYWFDQLFDWGRPVKRPT